MAEYQILDDLITASESRIQEFQERNNMYFQSGIEEVEEPFTGSADTIRLFIYKNYVSQNGLMNLAIIVRDVRTEQKSLGGLRINQVETSIFPLYAMQQTAFDLPPAEKPPELHPDTVRFIISKRTLPKKPQGQPEDKSKYKWTVNDIAAKLHISNRLVAQYCRVKNI